MKLGNYVQISKSVTNLVESSLFYDTLGFYKLSEGKMPVPWILYTDGVMNIFLNQSELPSLSLAYFSMDMKSRVKFLTDKGMAFDHQELDNGNMIRDIFADPNNLRVMLVHSHKESQMPNGASIALCGKFGELSIPTEDLRRSVEFWEKFEFKTINKSDVPYPWATLTDGLTTIGLHQSPELSLPALTYYSSDSESRITALKESGIQFLFDIVDTDGMVSNAITTSPDGQLFFIFKGD